MLELFQFITSGLWTFIGCTSFSVLIITSIGWSLNAFLIGFKGVKCDSPTNLLDDL